MMFAAGPRPRLSKVSLFARMNNFGEQVILLRFHVDAPADSKVFFALPVRPNGRCGFFRLPSYDQVFLDMDKCWEPSLVVNDATPVGQGSLDDVSLQHMQPTADEPGAVFLPKAQDIARAGGEDLLKHAPYHEWGCAAFAIRKGQYAFGPIAMVFETRDPTKIFFPTREIIERACPERVERDHRLYLQNWTGKRIDGWFESDSRAEAHVDIARSQRMVRGELLVHRLDLRGSRKNEDVWVRIG